MRAISLISKSLIIFLFCSACSQYAIELVDPEQGLPIEVLVPDSPENVEEKLTTYLRARKRLEKKLVSKIQAGRVMILQPWVRDSSLRYGLLRTDERMRHLCEWKAQWTLEPRGTQKTFLSVDVLEVIHLGPPSNKKRPEPEEIAAGAAKGDWYETPPDKIRSAVELRRFWTEYYLSKPLPGAIANVNVKDLSDPPLGKALINRQGKRLNRAVTY